MIDHILDALYDIYQKLGSIRSWPPSNWLESGRAPLNQPLSCRRADSAYISFQPHRLYLVPTAPGTSTDISAPVHIRGAP